MRGTTSYRRKGKTFYRLEFRYQGPNGRSFWSPAYTTTNRKEAREALKVGRRLEYGPTSYRLVRVTEQIEVIE